MAGKHFESKDTELFNEVQKLINGNYDSYENVYELSKRYIYKIINDVVQSHHTTEDLMQETYLQIYKKISTLNEAKAFYVWAGRIATNLSLRHIQKYRKEVAFAPVLDDEEDSGTIFDKAENDYEEFIPETVLHNKEQQRIIAEILESLSVEQKLCVQYYYYEEMSVNDIAELMQCSSGTIKSRLNYARKALKEAVSTFEVKNGVKLYSMAGLPVFLLVFKQAADALVFTGTALGYGAAAVAGGIAIEEAAVGSGATGGASVAGGVAVGGSASTAGGAAAGGATVTGTAVSTGAMATVAGKAAVVVTAICVGSGAAAMSSVAAQNEMIDTNGYVITFEEAREEVYASETYALTTPSNSNYSQFSEENYGNIEELLGNQTDVSYERLADLDEDYLEAVDKLAAELIRYQEAFRHSMTEEQYAYINQVMEGYLLDIENLLVQGEQFAIIESIDQSATFKNKYMPEYIELINEEAEIIGVFADIYSRDEVKEAFSNHSLEEMQEMLEEKGSVGYLIEDDLSQDTREDLDANSRVYLDWVNAWQAWRENVANDPELSEFSYLFQQEP